MKEGTKIKIRKIQNQNQSQVVYLVPDPQHSVDGADPVAQVWWTSPARPAGQWEAMMAGPDGKAIMDAITAFLEAGLSMSCLNEALEMMLQDMGH